MQCPNGHTLCTNCKRVHNCCPTCHSELGNIRCLALEKVAESLELPCRYQSLGCHDLLPYYGKIKHEKHCSFRPYTCPYASSECCVTGDIPFLVAHLKEDHSVDMHDGCTFNHRYVKSNPREVEKATWMLTVSRFTRLHFEISALRLIVGFKKTVIRQPNQTHFASSLYIKYYIFEFLPFTSLVLYQDLCLFHATPGFTSYVIIISHTHTQTHICAPIYIFFWRSPYSPFCKIDILTQKLYPPISTQVFNCFGRQFCLHFEAFLLGTAPVYMAFLRFMGEDKDARKFSYTLEVGAFGRKLIWQGVPRSIRDSHARVRDSQDGLIIPRSMALYFSAGTNQELKLRITGRIWKV